jgi:hypothetical protein
MQGEGWFGAVRLGCALRKLGSLGQPWLSYAITLACDIVDGRRYLARKLCGSKESSASFFAEEC